MLRQKTLAARIVEDYGLSPDDFKVVIRYLRLNSENIEEVLDAISEKLGYLPPRKTKIIYKLFECFRKSRANFGSTLET